MIDEAKVENLVAELKEWVLSEPEVAETSDELLRLFANLAKGDADVAKRRIMSYYSIRSSSPELFFDRDVDNDQMKTILDQYMTFISPAQTPEGYRVLFLQAANDDPKRYDMYAQMKYFLLTLDASLVDEDICPGYIFVFNIATLSATHVLKFRPSGVLKTSAYLQILKVNMIDEAKVENLVAELKEWVLSEPEVAETSDELLRLFANLAKGDADVAKGRIMSYYSIRSSSPELFFDRDVDNDQMKTILDQYMTFISPAQTPEGYRVLFLQAANDDPKRYDMYAQMKYFLLTLDASLVDEDVCPGYIVVFNIATLSATHVLKFRPSGVLKTSAYLQEGIPLDVKAVYLVNASPIADIMMRTIRPFMNCGIINRVNIIREGSLDKLYEKVPRDCLPSEYGGLLSESAPINEVNTQKLRRLKSVFASEEAALKALKASH